MISDWCAVCLDISTWLGIVLDIKEILWWETFEKWNLFSYFSRAYSCISIVSTRQRTGAPIIYEDMNIFLSMIDDRCLINGYQYLFILIIYQYTIIYHPNRMTAQRMSGWTRCQMIGCFFSFSLYIPIPDDDGSYQRMLFYFSTEITAQRPTGHNGFVLFLYPVYISIIGWITIMIDDRNIDYLLNRYLYTLSSFLYRMTDDRCFFYPLYLIISVRIANTLFITWNYVRLLGNSYISLFINVV